MNIQKYISSGILELYVAGSLSESENLEVQKLMSQYPEIKKEVLAIEASFMNLSGNLSPVSSSPLFDSIKEKIEKPSIRSPQTNKPSNWISNMGWAAAVLFAVGITFLFLKNRNLEKDLKKTKFTFELLDKELKQTKEELSKVNEINAILRNKNMSCFPLDGQKNTPQAYAKVFWDKQSTKIYLDVQGLPDPPADKVYQVWSLKLNPLTPISIGVLDDFTTSKTKVFLLENNNDSEAFGITLEPKGGSESPTLEQLFVLGTI